MFSMKKRERRRLDYIALGEQIVREHAEALALLDAYDRGEAEVINGKLKRITEERNSHENHSS